MLNQTKRCVETQTGETGDDDGLTDGEDDSNGLTELTDDVGLESVDGEERFLVDVIEDMVFRRLRLADGLERYN